MPASGASRPSTTVLGRLLLRTAPPALPDVSFPEMALNAKPTKYPAEVRDIGRQVTAASGVILGMALLGLRQAGNPPIGELSHFMHDSSLVVLPFCAWGLATGMGLTRAWRWARVSLLVFGVLLALVCAVPAAVLLIKPGAGLAPVQAWELRAVGLLLLVAPVLIVRWFFFFLRPGV